MTDPQQLSGIDIVGWVTRTTERIERAGLIDPAAWASAWLETYQELGGQHESVGRKGCPRAAAYALWILGRLKSSNRPPNPQKTQEVLQELGRNATYAVLAADACLESPETSAAQTWVIVKQRFRRETGEKPAEAEQGQVKIVWALAKAGLLRPSAALMRRGGQNG